MDYSGFVELVAILAVIQFFYFGYQAGMARKNSGLKAPAMTGDDGFERNYRVQMNTLEMLIAFLPSLFIAAKYWPALLVAGLGVVYLVGRFLYRRAYVTKPANRGLGFMLTMVPTAILMALSVIGILLSIFGI